MFIISRDINCHSGCRRPPDCGAFPKRVLSRHKAISIVLSFPASYSLARHSDGAYPAQYLLLLLRLFLPCCCWTFFRPFRFPERFCPGIRRKPRQNVFNKLPFLRGEVSGGRQLCDGQCQAGKAVEVLEFFFGAGIFGLIVVVVSYRSPKWAHT